MKRLVTQRGALTLCASALIMVLAGCDSDSDSPTPPDNNHPPVAVPVSTIAVIGEDTSIDVLAEFSNPEGESLALTEAKVVQGSGEAWVEDGLLWLVSNDYGMVQVETTVIDADGGETLAKAEVDVQVKASVQDYAGSDTCLRCHQDKASFKETGHNWKFSKVENGRAPDLPFTSLDGAFELYEGVENSAGTPESWNDISYLLGGFQRQAILLDKNGYMINGEKAMFDVLPKGETLDETRVVPFAPGAGGDGMPYTCGHCHNTGWRDYTSEPGDNRNHNRQDDLIGMEGTWALTGVQCEACHGAGGDHAKSPTKDNITRIAEGRLRADLMKANQAFGEPIACGECHTKAGERWYKDGYMTSYDEKFGGDTIGGFVKDYFEEGRNAGDALLGYDPDTGEATGKKRMFKCTTCHDPHLSTNFQDKPGHSEALKFNCQNCHPNMEFNDGVGELHGAVAECTDCHMPKNSHLFRIDLSHASEDPYQYGKDGKYRQPWLRPVQSCSACHEEDYDDRATRMGKVHK